MTIARRYACRYCPESFVSGPTRKAHVRRQHPEHKNAVTELHIRPLIKPRGPRPGGSLKRDTDVWPARA